MAHVMQDPYVVFQAPTPIFLGCSCQQDKSYLEPSQRDYVQRSSSEELQLVHVAHCSPRPYTPLTHRQGPETASFRVI